MIQDNLAPSDQWSRWLESFVVGIKDVGGGKILGRCPNPDHPDHRPSFTASRVEYWYKCFSCGIKGNPIQFAKMFNLDFSVFRGFDFQTGAYKPIQDWTIKASAPSIATSKTGSNPQIITHNRKNKSENNNANSPKEKKVPKNGDYDRKKESQLRWKLVPLSKENAVKGWRKSVVEALEVQWSASAKTLAFPMLDKNGVWVNCWVHKPVNRFLGGVKFHPTVYPLNLIPKYKPEEVTFLVEGYKDVLRMLSLGLPAICFTNGALVTPKDLSPLSHLKKFTIIYDDDRAGGKGMLKQVDALKAKFPTAAVNTTSWKPLTGTDVSDISDDLIAELISTEKSYKKGYNLMTVDQFLEADIPEPEPIVKHIMIEQGVSVFAATDGVGKSLLIQQLGLSISRGVPFLNHFEVVSPRPVLLLNYELMDGEVRKRLTRQMQYFSQYPEKHRFLINTRDKSKIFSDLWEDIESTIVENLDWLEGGVVLIDNMYSTSDRDLSNNRDCKDWLQNLNALKLEYELSQGLVAHFTKEWQTKYSILTKYPIEGGKTLTNHIDYGMVMGESQLVSGLRIGKLIKTRSSSSRLKDIPFKMYFDEETWVFERGVIIDNEAVHFQPPKSRQEVEALKAVKLTIHHKHPKDGKAFFGFDEYKESLLDITKKDDSPTATVYNWLKRLKEWGYITQPYEGVWKIVQETLEDQS